MKKRNILISAVLVAVVVGGIALLSKGEALQGFTKLYKFDSKPKIESGNKTKSPNTKNLLDIKKNNSKVEPIGDLQLPNANPGDIIEFSDETNCKPLELYLTDEKSIHIGNFDGHADIMVTGFNNPVADQFLSAGIALDDLSRNDRFRVRPGDSFSINSSNVVGNEYQIGINAHDLANVLVGWTDRNILLKVKNFNPKDCGITDFYLENIDAEINRPDFIVLDVDGAPVWVRHAGSDLQEETSVLDLKLIGIVVRNQAPPQGQAVDWDGSAEVGDEPWKAIVRDGDKLTIDADSDGLDDFNVHVNRNDDGDLHLEWFEL